MQECLMGACKTKGVSNYHCAECSGLKIFMCEGCEVELLNDVKALGKVSVACIECSKTQFKFSERAKHIRIAPLMKNSEKLRQSLVDSQRFEESVCLRDLMILVKDSYPYLPL